MLQTALQSGLPGAKIVPADDFHAARNHPDAQIVDVVVCAQSALPNDARPNLFEPQKPIFQSLYLLSDRVNESSVTTAALVNASGNFEKSSDGICQLMTTIHADQRAQMQNLGQMAELQRLTPATDRYRQFFETSPIGFIELEATECMAALQRLRLRGVTDLATHLAAHPQEWVSLIHKIHIRKANHQAMDLLGAEETAQLAGSVGRVFCRNSIETVKDEILALWKEKDALRKDIRLTRFDGYQLPVQLHFHNQVFPAGQRSFCTLAMVDVSEHHRLMDELEFSKQRHQSLSKASFEAIFFSRKGVCLDQNQTAERMFGYSREEALGRMGTDWIAESDREMVMQKMMEGSEEAYEARAVRKDGSTFPCEIQARMFEAPGQEPMRVTALRDISKRTHAKNFNKFFSQVLNNSPNEVLILDRESLEIIGANGSARERLGLDEEVCSTQSFFKMFKLPEEQSLQQIVSSFGTEQVEFKMISGEIHRRDQSITPVEIHAQNLLTEPPAVTLVIIDVTERIEAQKQKQLMDRRLQQAQKMESLGILAGGVAHDFNNILMSILGNADLAAYSLDSYSPAQKHLSEIVRASKRAAALAKQMLAYSGKGAFVVGPWDFSEIVRDMAHLLKVSIAKNSTLRLKLSANLPTVMADVTQIRQVVMNLITNASESHCGELGTIDICTGVSDLAANDLQDFGQLAPASWSEELKPGRYVYLGVKDSGCGMDQKTLERIFDPFFSTKFTGRGLGMSAVLGIVRGHRGLIRLASEVGKGSQFQVFLPASDVPLKPVPKPAKESALSPTQTSKRILIVDDEADVRTIAVEIFDHLEQQAVAAEGGIEAMKILEEQQFDLVLLDLTMPEMDGLQTFQKIHQSYPELKVVLCSGYREQEATRDFPTGQLHGFLQKPYGVKKIKRALQQFFH